jgi:alpha-glucuronidase
MTGSKHNPEGNSSDSGEPDPGPYWRRMHRDWRFWVGAVFMAAALAIYVSVAIWRGFQTGHRQPAMPASTAN